MVGLCPGHGAVVWIAGAARLNKNRSALGEGQFLQLVGFGRRKGSGPGEDERARWHLPSLLELNP